MSIGLEPDFKGSGTLESRWNPLATNYYVLTTNYACKTGSHDLGLHLLVRSMTIQDQGLLYLQLTGSTLLVVLTKCNRALASICRNRVEPERYQVKLPSDPGHTAWAVGETLLTTMKAHKKNPGGFLEGNCRRYRLFLIKECYLEQKAGPYNKEVFWEGVWSPHCSALFFLLTCHAVCAPF